MNTNIFMNTTKERTKYVVRNLKKGSDARLAIEKNLSLSA